MDFKDVNPRINCGVGYKKLFTYREKRGSLAEFIDDELRKLSNTKEDGDSYTVKIDEDGDIFCESRHLDFFITSTAVIARTEPITSFHPFEQDITQIFVSVLNYIGRKNILYLGMTFKSDFSINKGINVTSVFKDRIFQLRKENLSTLKTTESEISRFAFELRFEEASCLRHLIARIEKDDEQSDKVLISLDSRIKEREINNNSMFSEFFQKTAYDYFLNSVVNGFMKGIFELRVETGGQNE